MTSVDLNDHGHLVAQDDFLYFSFQLISCRDRHAFRVARVFNQCEDARGRHVRCRKRRNSCRLRYKGKAVLSERGALSTALQEIAEVFAFRERRALLLKFQLF